MRRLLGLTRPHAGLLLGATVAGVVSLSCGLSLPLFTEHLVNNAILGHRRSLIVPLALGYLGVAAVRAFSNFLRRNLSGEAAVRVEAQLRVRLFAHLQGLPVSFHDRWESGQLLARATSDLDSIRNFVGYAVVFLGFLFITSIGVVAAIAVQSVAIALFAAFLALPFLWAATRFNTKMEALAAESRESVGAVATVVSESVSGIRILKAFGVEHDSVQRVERAAGHLRSTNIEIVRRRAFYIPLLTLI